MCVCRLSYHQRIVDIVPPSFSALIPADPLFQYKYGEDTSSESHSTQTPSIHTYTVCLSVSVCLYSLTLSTCALYHESRSSPVHTHTHTHHTPLTEMFLLSVPTGSLPGYPVSITVGNAIKNRASNDEIITVLKDVPNPNQEDDDGNKHTHTHTHAHTA